MSNTQKKNTFFGGAAILTVGVILVKLIGALYKIPLVNILGDSAYGDFNAAYNIYNLFLTISTAGLPVALSKTISEANALDRQNQVQRIFKVAFLTFLALGLVSFLCMSVFAKPLTPLIVGNEKAVLCVMALSPSVLCVCVMSAFRGYAQGHSNMVPTTISQIIEAVFKLVMGLGLAMGSNLAIGLFTGLLEQAGVGVRAFPPDFSGGPLAVLIMLFSLTLLPAILEELLFRGVLLQPLRRYGDRIAVVLSALAFALCHTSLPQVLNAFLLGLVLGVLTVRTGSLLTSMALHLLYNGYCCLVSLLWYYAPTPGVALASGLMSLFLLI
ncbi:MAG: oligosaccharide flippase family protein, partial [Pseudoflavonifractor sp.]